MIKRLWAASLVIRDRITKCSLKHITKDSIVTVRISVILITFKKVFFNLHFTALLTKALLRWTNKKETIIISWALAGKYWTTIAILCFYFLSQLFNLNFYRIKSFFSQLTDNHDTWLFYSYTSKHFTTQFSNFPADPKMMFFTILWWENSRGAFWYNIGYW